MFRDYLICILFIFAISSCKNESKKQSTNQKLFKERSRFQIEGVLAQNKSTYVYLYNQFNEKIDSTKIRNFSFKFKGSVGSPKLNYLSFGDTIKHPIILENSNYRVLSSNDQMTVIGGKLNTRYAKYKSQKTHFALIKSDLLERFSKLELGLRPFLTKIDSIRKIEKKLFLQFILDNHTNILSNIILENTHITSKEALSLKSKLNKSSENARLFRKLDILIDDLKIAEAEEKIQRRKPVPLFSGINPEGKQTHLEKIIKNKKLFLIDFWASWCPPCRQASPELKNLYNKYRRYGFDILTVSEDRSVDEWKSGIFIDGIEDWHHIYDDFNRISSMFSVGALPHMVLIDENGKIIKNKISMDRLAQELDKKFNTNIKDE